MGSGIQYNLSKFAVDMLGRRDAIKRDLDILKTWAI